MASEFDDQEWRIEIPAKVKERLNLLLCKLNDVMGLADDLEAKLARCPTRNEISVVLDHKLDTAYASKIERDMTEALAAIRAQQDGLKAYYSKNIEDIKHDLLELQRASNLVTHFQEDYSRLRDEASQLTDTIKRVERFSEQNVQDMRLEHEETQKAFKYLTSEASSMRERLDTLQARLDTTLEAFAATQRDHATSSARLDETYATVGACVQKMTDDAPAAITRAVSSSEERIRELIHTQDLQRQTETQAVSNMLDTLLSRATGIDAQQQELAGSLAKSRTMLSVQLDEHLDGQSRELYDYINATLGEFTQLRDSVTQSMADQKAVLNKLEKYVEVFSDTDVFWKHSIQALDTEFATVREKLEQTIVDDIKHLREVADTSAKSAEVANKLIDQASSTWETEWSIRERDVDDTLKTLHKLVNRVDDAVSNETQTRAAEYGRLKDAMDGAFCALKENIDRKADMEDVRKALWTKVDKLDL